jgi:hypothetical protein
MLYLWIQFPVAVIFASLPCSVTKLIKLKASQFFMLFSCMVLQTALFKLVQI